MDIRKMKRMNYPKICDIFPNTKGVHCYCIMIHNSAITGRIEKILDFHVLPSQSSFIEIDCLNKECTEGYFDLSSQVANAITNHKKLKGIIKCTGKESEKFLKNRTGFSCDTTLDYLITPLE